MGIVAKGGMKVYTSGVYGELVLRSATTWPSGLLFGVGDMFFEQNSGNDAEWCSNIWEQYVFRAF